MTIRATNAKLLATIIMGIVAVVASSGCGDVRVQDAPPREATFYVANWGTATIGKYDSTGGYSLFSRADTVNLYGLVLGPDGCLYATSGLKGSGTILKFDTEGKATVFATGLNQTAGLAFDSRGMLYGANAGDNTILKFNPSGSRTVFANSGMNQPCGLAFDRAGNLYTANTLGNNIVKFDSSGKPLVFASGLNYPTGLAFDAGGNLYVADSSNKRIVKYDRAGRMSVFANLGVRPGPSLIFDGGGNLYTPIWEGNKILKFTPSGTPSVFANSGMNYPAFIAVRFHDQPGRGR